MRIAHQGRLAWLAVVAVVTGLVAVVGVTDLSEGPATAAVSAKHTICHRTASTTNPYRRITVSINAIYSGGSGNFKNAKHPIHNNYAFKAYDANSNGILAGSELTALAAVHSYDNTFFGYPVGRITVTNSTVSAVTLVTFDGNSTRTTDNVFRSSITYPAQQKKWGDIIPPYQSNWDKLNYGQEGQDIFSGAVSGCRRMSTLEFVDSEVTAGTPFGDIMTDLDEQAASEDLALRQSLGTTFAQWYANNPGAGLAAFTAMVAAENPAVDTLDAGNVLTTSAQLRGTGSPRGVSTTFYFQLATSSAGVAAASRLATGVTSQSLNDLSLTLNRTGLTNGQTYYYRLIGVSNLADPDSLNDTVETVAEGDIVEFTMGAAAVATSPETNVGQTSATMNGEAMPNSVNLRLTFQYATTIAGVTLSAHFNTGMLINGSAATTSAAAASVTVSAGLTGLTPNTTYYYRLVGQKDDNSYIYGSIEDFTTFGNPTGSTHQPSNITFTSATINGLVNPNAIQTDLYFQFATTSAGVSTSSEFNTGMKLDGGSATTSASSLAVAVEAPVSNLVAGQRYYYRLIGRLASNNAVAFTGQILDFATLPPVVTTDPESLVTQTTAQMNGTVEPKSIPVTYYFQWGTTNSFSAPPADLVNTGMRIGGSLGTTSSAGVSVSVTMPLSGLTAGTTYYYRIVGEYSDGSSTHYLTGGIEDFTTTASPQNNQGGTTPPAAIVSPPPSSSTAPTGPPASTSGGGKDPRIPDDKPLNEKVVVDLGPSNPGGGGSVQIAPTNGGPALELLGASIDDPNYDVTVVSSGVEYNKPETWVKEGFGDECWKIEPGGSSYLLPANPTPPSGRAGGTYSAVKVKAGSLTSDDPNFQVNTLFLSPAGGSMVWPDSNKDGVYNPGGRTGDKDISHVILCVKYGSPSSPTTASPTTASPTTASPTTASPTTASPTTGAPTTTFAVPTTTFTSTTVPSSTPQIEVLVQPKDPQAATTAPPGIAKLSLVVSSGTTQQTLELRINLSKFSLVGGNIPLPQLPKTGSSSDNVVRIGIVLMAFGVLMIATRRRLRKTF